MTHKVFIDGEAGTTGLQIRDRLAGRSDLEILSIDPARRKDPEARAELLNAADAVVLCLPDAASKEAVSLITSSKVRVIDASTAYRVASGWTYGFPEMDADQRAAIRASTRVSNPGCYPTGFIALMRPLVTAGLVPEDYPVTVNAISGYSGGGKGLIEEFEADPASGTQDAFRPVWSYPGAQAPRRNAELFRHLPCARLCAVRGRFAQGMIVEVPLHLWALTDKPKPGDLRDILAKAYDREAFVSVAGAAECERLQQARAGAGGMSVNLILKP